MNSIPRLQFCFRNFSRVMQLLIFSILSIVLLTTTYINQIYATAEEDLKIQELIEQVKKVEEGFQYKYDPSQSHLVTVAELERVLSFHRENSEIAALRSQVRACYPLYNNSPDFEWKSHDEKINLLYEDLARYITSQVSDLAANNDFGFIEYDYRENGLEAREFIKHLRNEEKNIRDKISKLQDLEKRMQKFDANYKLTKTKWTTEKINALEEEVNLTLQGSPEQKQTSNFLGSQNEEILVTVEVRKKLEQAITAAKPEQKDELQSIVISYNQKQAEILQKGAISFIITIPTAVATQFSNNRLGLSSGDEMKNLGLWTQISLGSAEQKKNDKSEAYKASGFSGAIGFDVGNDNGIIGGCYNFSKANLILDNQATENKLQNQILSHLLSSYGSLFLTPQICLSAQVGGGVGNLEIQDGSRKNGLLFFGNLTGKYYLDISNHLSLQPKCGVEIMRYSYGDEEKNLLSNNQKIEANRVATFLAIGIKTSITNGDFMISPELSIGGEMLLSSTADSNKDLGSIHIPKKAISKALDAKSNDVNENLTLLIDGSINISKSSIFNSMIGLNYRVQKDFHSLMGFFKISLSI